MAPKNAADHLSVLDAATREAPPGRKPIWIYGINDHLDLLQQLPASFKAAGFFRSDYVRLCDAVGAVPHSALKPKLRKNVPARRGSRSGLEGLRAPMQPGGPRLQMRRSSRGGFGDEQSAEEGAAPVMRMRRGSRCGFGDEFPAERESLPPPVEDQDPILAVRSMILDRFSLQLLALLLPTSQHLKVLCFSACRLDVEMLKLLNAGLKESCVESLQIEWNCIELPLPTCEEMEAAAAVAASRAAASGQEKCLDLPVKPTLVAGVGAPGTEEACGCERDLEARERRRYLLQSRRTLQKFRDCLIDYAVPSPCRPFTDDSEWEDSAGLEIQSRSLEVAWRALEAPPIDVDSQLTFPELQEALDSRLGISGEQVSDVLEVLDGPDYGGGMGRISLAALRAAIEGVAGEGADDEVDNLQLAHDPVGLALAAFADPERGVLESLSFRSCGLGKPELLTLAATLKKCPWQLRCLNMWDNQVCDRAAEALADAFEEYRGLEYLGLGRNRVTHVGLAALCRPFNLATLDEEQAKEARDRIKHQEIEREAAEKAKAKAKAKAAPPVEGARERREAPPGLHDDLREFSPREEGGQPTWVLKRPSELKALNVAENPIRDARAVEALQPYGPEGTELIIKGTTAAAALLARGADPRSRGRRASGHPPCGPEGLLEGWTLRLL